MTTDLGPHTSVFSRFVASRHALKHGLLMPGARPAAPTSPQCTTRHLSFSSYFDCNAIAGFCETPEVYPREALPEGVIRTDGEQQPGLLSHQAGFIQLASQKPGKKGSLCMEERAPKKPGSSLVTGNPRLVPTNSS